jgi:hypothetical protein
MPQMRVLYLNGTGITDAALAHLANFGQLEWLDLKTTQVTEDGVARLRLILPKAQIFR